MPVDVIQCWGALRPMVIHSSPPSPQLAPPIVAASQPITLESELGAVLGPEPKTIIYQGFQGGSTWEGWSPARIRAAHAEHRAFNLRVQRKLKEESAATASKMTGPELDATESDIRVYTRLKNGKHRYWGVKDDDMTIEEFWAIKDPENTREQDDTQQASIDPVPAPTDPLPNSQSMRVNSSSPSLQAPIVAENQPMTLPESEPNTVPGTEPMITRFQGFEGGSTWEDWSPAQIREAKAENRAFNIAIQRKLEKEYAVTASTVTGSKPDATYSRIYSRLKNGQYRYWGAKDDGMTIEEFWTEKDPENTREQDDTQQASIDPFSAPTEPLPNSQSLRTSAAPKSRRRQKRPEVSPKHRIRKSSTVTPPVNERTRKSLANKLDAKHPGLDKQVRDVTESTPKDRTSSAHLATPEESDRQAKKSGKRSDASKNASDQPPRKQAGRGRPRKVQPGVVESVRPKAAGQRTSKPDDLTPSSLPKRKRGRPAKENPSTESSKKQKRAAAETKAKITKPKKEKWRSSAPSSHKMRTRTMGPVEHLQLT